MEVGKKKILNGFIGGNNSTQFVIPIYQRNYVWEKKNVLQLLVSRQAFELGGTHQ